VGIGTSSPSQKLTVDGNILQTSGDYLSTDLVQARSTGGLKLYDDGGNGIFVENGGNVGVGTNSPSNKLTISGNADFTGNVGIGTNNPSQKLTVNGNILQTSGDYLSTDRVRARSSGGLEVFDDGGKGIFIKDGGYVGIGTSNPACPLQVSRSGTSGGSAGFFSHYGGSYTFYGITMRAGKDSEAHFLRLYRGASNTYSGSLGYHTGGLQLFQPSDKRLKTNIRNSQMDGLNILQNIRVVDYDLKSGEVTKITGYIAQEAMKAYPDMVYYDKEEDLYTISTAQLIPVMHKAIQELAEENEELIKRLEKIEALILKGDH